MFEQLLTTPAFLGYIAFAGLVLLPFYNMYRRAGLNRYWPFVLFVPYTGIFIVMGILAFKRWPSEPVKPPKGKAKKNG
mgnify:CR=1 FL=1